MNDINIIDLMMEFPLDINLGNNFLSYINGEWFVCDENTGDIKWFECFNEALTYLVYLYT